MDSKGKTDSIVPLVIILIAAMLVVFYLIGGFFIGKTEIEENVSHICNIEKFSVEYGDVFKNERLFLNGNDFFIVEFDRGWRVPFDCVNEKIIENEEEALKRFYIQIYNDKIQDVPSGFYTSTEECYRIPKGASVACGVVVTTKEVLGTPFATVVATIPTEYASDFAASLVSEGGKKATKSVAKGTITVFKTIKTSSTVNLAFDIVETLGCPLGNTRQRIVFDLAENARNIFENAKEGNYSDDTIAILDATNASIQEIMNIKLDPKPPKNTLQALGELFETFVEIGLNLAAPECAFEKQLQKFKNFEDRVEGSLEVANSYFDNFYETLTELKSKAQNAIDLEEKTKSENAPSWLQWGILPSKSLYYWVQDSGSNKLFGEQMYVSSKEAAESKTEYYLKYWGHINPIHWFFSAVVYLVIATFVFFIIRDLLNGSPEYGGGIC